MPWLDTSIESLNSSDVPWLDTGIESGIVVNRYTLARYRNQIFKLFRRALAGYRNRVWNIVVNRYTMSRYRNRIWNHDS